MTTVHKIGTGNLSGSDGVDLTDRTKWNVIIGDDSNQVERDISSLCSAPCSPTGGSALLKKSRIPYIKRPLTIWAKSSSGSYQAELDNIADIIDVINDARASNLNQACTDQGLSDNTPVSPAQYAVLKIGDQTTPDVWTILDGDYSFTKRELSGIPYIVLRVELLLMPGAAFLDGSGYPASGVNPPSLPM